MRTLASIHESALHPSHFSLTFHLYGAMIGARVAGEEVAPKARVDKLMGVSLKYEEEFLMDRGDEEHSCNAICLLWPGVLEKRVGDPSIKL